MGYPARTAVISTPAFFASCEHIRDCDIGDIEACDLPPQAREENAIASFAHANIQSYSRLEAFDNIHHEGRGRQSGPTARFGAYTLLNQSRIASGRLASNDSAVGWRRPSRADHALTGSWPNQPIRQA